MRLSTDDLNLSLVLELTDEHADLDLTAEDLGARILEQAAGELAACWRNEQAPDGSSWARNAGSTVQRKGHDKVGWQTGEMLDPSKILSDSRQQIEPRWCSRGYDHDGTGSRSYLKARSFHSGHEGAWVDRPLIGWTARASQIAAELVGQADADARHRAGE